MSISRLPRVACLAAFTAQISCGGGDPLVELRLYPCDVDGLPKSVRIELQGYDAGGSPFGAPLSAAFTIPSVAVFSDNYATVGYARPPEVVRADLTVAWFNTTSAGEIAESEHVVFLSMVSVPTPDTVLEVPAQGCMPWMGGTDSDSDTTTDPSTTDATTTTDSTTTTDPTTTTGATTTTDSTTTTDATTDTSDATTDATTDATDSDTTTGEALVCDPPGDFQKCESEPGQAGTAYECISKMMGGEWQADAAICEQACADADAEAYLDLQQGVSVGCSGQSAEGWACLCKEGAFQVSCTPMDQKCVGEILHLCVDGELAKAGCINGCVGGDQPICAP